MFGGRGAGKGRDADTTVCMIHLCMLLQRKKGGRETGESYKKFGGNQTLHWRVEGGSRSRRSQMVMQRTKPQGGVEGGRSHGVDLTDDTLGATHGNGAAGDPGGTDLTKSPHYIAGTGD